MRTRSITIILGGIVASATVVALAMAMPSRSLVTEGRSPVLSSALAAQADSAPAVSALAKAGADASRMFGELCVVGHNGTSGAPNNPTEFPGHALTVVAQPPASAGGSATGLMTRDRRTGMVNRPPIISPGSQMVDGTPEPGAAAMIADGQSIPSAQPESVPPPTTCVPPGRRVHGRSHFGSLHMQAAFHPPLPRSPG